MVARSRPTDLLADGGFAAMLVRERTFEKKVRLASEA